MVTKEMIKDAKKYMEQEISQNKKRIEHLKSTAKTAKKLAKIHDVNNNSAYFAAILHDVTKHYEKQKVLKILLDEKVKDTYLIDNYKLAHGLTAAILIHKRYKIKYSGDIFNSVKYHTYGRKNMSKLEKIVYLADLIEPSRDFKGINEIRETAQLDLDKAILMAAISTINYLLKNNKIIHPNTIELYNEICK